MLKFEFIERVVMLIIFLLFIFDVISLLIIFNIAFEIRKHNIKNDLFNQLAHLDWSESTSDDLTTRKEQIIEIVEKI